MRQGIMVYVLRSGHGATSSNRGRDYGSYSANTTGEKYESNYSPSNYG